MSRGRPSLLEIPLWDREEHLILDTFRPALLLLLSRRKSDAVEGELNRLLFECYLEARRSRKAANQPVSEVPPTLEARNAPDPSTAGMGSEKKIPDFQFSFFDDDVADPQQSVAHFVIECKRLEPKSQAGWGYTLHYVKDGIRRFVHKGWRYGLNAPSAAMVGYLDKMTFDQALAEVNASIPAAKPLLTPLELVNRDASGGELGHDLQRTFLKSPFHLTHLWVGPLQSG